MRRQSFMSGALLAFVSISPIHAQLSKSDRTEIVEYISRELIANYVFPDVGATMAYHVRRQLSAGAYDGITEPAAFATKLTNELRAISKDRHLRVARRGEPSTGPTPARPGTRVVFSEIMENNIGYMKITLIAAPPRLGDELRVAFENLKSTDALIIDLRDNLGGSPDGVSLIAGYLIPERTLLARIYSRPNNDTTAMTTTVVKGPHYTRDVYILTNNLTFSAAEALAYHMKHLGRAKIVGEPSGGGAHRIFGTDLPGGLTMSIPSTRPINVVTGTDWEGTGVLPDIRVPAAGAREAAVKAIRPN